MKSTYQKVKQLLTDYEYLRDDRKRLTSFIHREELFDLGIIANNLSYTDFEDLVLYGKLTDHCRIDRAKRRVEYDYPKLQGKTWNKRQEHSKNVAKYMK